MREIIRSFCSCLPFTWSHHDEVPPAPCQDEPASVTPQAPSNEVPPVPRQDEPASVTPQAPSNEVSPVPRQDESASVTRQAPSNEDEPAPVPSQAPSNVEGPAPVIPHSPSMNDEPARVHPQENDASDVDLDNSIDLDNLVEKINELFDLANDSKKMPRDGKRTIWPTGSKGLEKLEKFMSAGIDVATDASNDIVNKGIKSVLEVIGKASIVTAGLLMVVYVLERFEAVSANKTECLSLLKEMKRLAIVIKQYKKSLSLKNGMDNEIREATKLIAEGSQMVFAQIKSSNFARFFSSSSNAAALSAFEDELDHMYRTLNSHMNIHIYKAIICGGGPSRKSQNAVGIEKSIKDVVDLLDWTNDEKKAGAVIIHGFGGVGKTTLAQAVFSQVNFSVKCKYSKVTLYNSIGSEPNNIEELQKKIYNDLKGERMQTDVRVDGDGQGTLGTVLKDVEAFIYIDNVLNADMLSKLLPESEDMQCAKKVRLLITARDLNVSSGCQMSTPPKSYLMTGFSSPKYSRELLENKMSREKVEEMKPGQIETIINICGGIPLMLKLVAGALCSTENKQDIYERVIREMEGLKGQTIEDNIDGSVVLKKDRIYQFFSYDTLSDMCKDAFLDICIYFKDWDWETVADIVGEDQLKRLEESALVTKDTNGLVNIHDVILRINHLIMSSRMEEGIRLKFTTASELGDFLEGKDEEEIQGMRIKCIWLTENEDPELQISASKLNSMHKTLRVFALEHKTVVNGERQKGFEELVFFKAKIGRLPFVASKSKKLRYLSYNSEDLILPEMPLSLRHLELDGYSNPHAFEISSNGVQQLSNLKKLILIRFEKLKNLPPKLGDLNDLQELILSECRSIEELPESISNLQSLKVLRVDECSSLRHLPKDVGSLSSLQKLCFEYCYNLEDLEESIGQLKLNSLLDMTFCWRLKNLPDGFCNLSLITNLSLKNCKSLERLPDRFGELKSLRNLSLKGCESLKRLPDRFGELESLRVLNLEGCKSLHELPESFGQLKYLADLNLSQCWNLTGLCSDFHSLSSLQRLDLTHCSRLEEECMYKVVQIKALEVVNIEKTNMYKTLEKIQGGQSLHFLVIAEGFSRESNSEHGENILKRTSSQFSAILTNGQGEPFHLSDLDVNTLILLIFHCSEDFFLKFPWCLIDETIDDDHTDFRMIYVGKFFNDLPQKVAKGFLAHGPYDSGLFDKAFALGQNALRENNSHTLYYRGESNQMRTKVVDDSKGVKYLSGWEFLSEKDMQNMFLGKCKRYLQLKTLEKTPQNGNIPLLRELFKGKDEEAIFLRNDEQKGGFHELQLQGKMILLEIRHSLADECVPNDMAYGSLMEMYKVREEIHDFEIITILMGEYDEWSDKEEDSHGFSREVPWLVVQNPKTITEAAKYFLLKDCSWKMDEEVPESCYPIRYRIIEPNGRIKGFRYVLNMMERWGPESLLFTDEKIEELKRAEWNQMKTMSHLEFIFMHSETVLNQVKKAKLEGKMICFFGGCEGCEWTEATTHSISNLLLPLRDNIHIIYVPTYSLVDEDLDATILGEEKIFYILEEPQMPQVEMVGMSLLNLSEHDSARLYRRVSCLCREIDEEKLDGMRSLLNCFRNHSKPWMIFVDDNDEMGISYEEGQEIMEFFSNESNRERSMQLLSKSSANEERKLALLTIKGLIESIL